MSWRGKYLALGDVTGAIFLLYFDVVNNYSSPTNLNAPKINNPSLRSSDNKIESPNKSTNSNQTANTTVKLLPKISVKLKFIKRVNTSHGYVRKLKFCPTHIDPSLSILSLFADSQVGLYQLSPTANSKSTPESSQSSLLSSDSSSDLSATNSPSVPSFTRNLWFVI
jgi:hypothetical protein